MPDSLATGLTYLPLNLTGNTINETVDPADLATFPIGSRSVLKYGVNLFVQEYPGAATYILLWSAQGNETPPSEVAGIIDLSGASFRLDDKLHGYLTSEAPRFNLSNFAVVPGIVMTYYVQHVQNPGNFITDKTIQYAYRGTLSRKDFASYGTKFFTKFLAENKAFLTNQPNKIKLVQDDTQDYLYFLLNFSPLPTEIRQRVYIKYVDGTSTTFTNLTFTNPQAYSVLCVPVGFQVFGFDSDVLYFEVWLSNEDDERISEVRKYRKDNRYRRNTRQILFQNSLGVFETITTLGRSSNATKVVRTTTDRYDPIEPEASYAETYVTDVKGERTLVFNTGFINAEQLEYFQELLYSREIYLIGETDYEPLLLTNDSITTADDDTNLRSLQLSFKIANQEPGYSKLPALPAATDRPTTWVGAAQSCEVNSITGLRTGNLGYNLLQLYYADDNTPVKPYKYKANTIGTAGYIAPASSGACASPAFLSAAITRLGTYLRDNCTPGNSGTFATITVSSGAFGSEISQADADAKAEAEYTRINTQAYANTNGSCIAVPVYYSDQITGIALNRKATCSGGQYGTRPSIVIAQGAFSSTVDKATADAAALADYNSKRASQSYSNTNGSCLTLATNPNSGLFGSTIAGRFKVLFQREDGGGGGWGTTTLNNYPFIVNDYPSLATCTLGNYPKTGMTTTVFDGAGVATTILDLPLLTGTGQRWIFGYHRPTQGSKITVYLNNMKILERNVNQSMNVPGQEATTSPMMIMVLEDYLQLAAGDQIWIKIKGN